jgi:hypothetical protein
MSFLGRKKNKDDKKSDANVVPASDAPPMIDPATGLPPPYEPPDPDAPKDEPKGNIFQRFGAYLIDSYNGLYKIVLEPSMPTKQTVFLVLLGMIFGMIVGYVISPVEFTGASPRRMNNDAIEQWVRMVAVGYVEEGRANEIAYDGPTALAVLQQLPNPKQVVAKLSSDSNLLSHEQEAIARLQNIQGFNELTGTVAPKDPGLVGSLVNILIPLIVMMIVIPIFVIVWRLLIFDNLIAPVINQIRRARNPELRAAQDKAKKELETLQDIKRIKDEMAENVVADAELGEPVMQTISIYTKGRNYDDSFAIELGPDQGSQFLGECGASIATKAGDDVQSVEFWGFDMATQATLTKIFAAPAAVTDPALQAKLGPRVQNPATDIIAAELGAKLTLETDSIRIQGEIVSVSHNDAGDTPNSGIENMQLKILTWQKQGSPVGMPAGGPPPIPPAQPLPDYGNIQFEPPPQMPAAPPPAGGKSMDDYAGIQFDPPPQMPISPPPPPPAGGKSMDDYADIQFDPPPQMPAAPAPPPAGGKSMDDYADIQFDPPPQMPGVNPLSPPPLQMPPSGLNPLSPPPLQMPPPRNDDEDDDPFGGTGDFTPLS